MKPRVEDFSTKRRERRLVPLAVCAPLETHKNRHYSLSLSFSLLLFLHRLFFVSTGYRSEEYRPRFLERKRGLRRRRMAGHFVNLSPGSRRSARENERKTPRDEGKNHDRSCSRQEVLGSSAPRDVPLFLASLLSFFFSFLFFSFFPFFFPWRGRVQSFCTRIAFTSGFCLISFSIRSSLDN